MIELPDYPCIRRVSKYTTLHVVADGTAFFAITVKVIRDEVQRQSKRKVYVARQQPFADQLANVQRLEMDMRATCCTAIEHEVKRRNEQKAAERKELQDRQKMAKRQRFEKLYNAAHADVRAVCAFYGPVIKMREPFFIQQWI